MIEFKSSPNPTIGVEIELQLIDDNTFDLKNIAPNIILSRKITYISLKNEEK